MYFLFYFNIFFSLFPVMLYYSYTQKFSLTPVLYYWYSYCVSFCALLDGVCLSGNKMITYLLTYLISCRHVRIKFRPVSNVCAETGWQTDKT